MVIGLHDAATVTLAIAPAFAFGYAFLSGSSAGALAVAFVVTLPINRAPTSSRRGHAVVHGMHGHPTPDGERPRPPAEVGAVPGRRRESAAPARRVSGWRG